MENSLIPWKTIKINGFKNAKEVERAFFLNYNRVNSKAIANVNKIIKFPSEGSIIQVVKVKIYDLNFFKGAYHKNLLALMQKLNLEFCPEEIVLSSLEEGCLPETLNIPGDKYTFVITKDVENNSSYLNSYDTSPDYLYASEDYVILQMKNNN
jgi:hypothetical protein